MRRLLPPLLVAALVTPTAPALADHVTARPLATACPDNQVSTGGFTDVTASSPFELAISCLADYEVTRGRTATSYAPAGTVLRQQMAQFLFRLGSQVFDPSGDVTRGQMASFLARLTDAAGAAGADGFTATQDTFDDDAGLVHEPSIDRIAAAGVTSGRGSDRFFDPHSASPASR